MVAQLEERMRAERWHGVAGSNPAHRSVGAALNAETPGSRRNEEASPRSASKNPRHDESGTHKQDLRPAANFKQEDLCKSRNNRRNQREIRIGLSRHNRSQRRAMSR